MKIYPLYLTTTGTFFNETVRDRPEGFPEYQFILTLEGSGLFYFAGNKIEIEPGTLLIIPPNIPHNYKKKGDIWVTHWIAFNGNNIGELFEKVLPKSIVDINIKLNDKLFLQFEEVNNLTFTNYKKNALKISSIIYGMIADIVYKIDNKDKSNNSSPINLDRVISYINKNYYRDISLDELAMVEGISSQYLCRLFKVEMGIRPFEYLKQFRINRAKTLILENPDKKIEEISKEVGFNNPSYFGVIFKQLEGKTPKEYLRTES